MMLKLILPLLVVISLYAFPSRAEDQASALFKSSISSIFQIAVVDKRSQEKDSIGTGFLFEIDEGKHLLLGTNYHVISDFTRDTVNYEIQYRTEDGRSGLLDLVAVDVARDLAILTSKEKVFSAGQGLVLRDGDLSKGQSIFAMGNPHDKGMMVVQGAYGGMIRNAFNEFVIFAGASLNPGMSGGPAVDESGKVVGVNVLTAGNDLNYLVPVAALRALFEASRDETQVPDRTSTAWRQEIAAQVLKRQRTGIETLLKASPEIANLEGLSFPKKLDASFKCWGGGEKRGQKVNFDKAWLVCQQEDDVFLKSGLNTGKIKYALSYVDGSPASQLGFDYDYSDRYGSSWLAEDKNEVDVTEFTCDSGFTQHAGKNWKSALCTRRYKGYPGLYDVYFSSALLGQSHKGYYYKVSLEGVDQELARMVLAKLTGSIAWTK